MTKNDRAALELAINHARAIAPERAAQVDGILKADGWLEAAQFASYFCQWERLGLFNETPPCMIEDQHIDLDTNPRQHGWPEAVRLRRQMRDLGISRYHPDPLAANEEAKKQKVAS